MVYACCQILRSSRISESSFAMQAEKHFYNLLVNALGITTHQPAQPLIQPAALSVTAPLTKKESELLELLCRGLSNADIANYCYVSLDTVKWHLKNLYKKLGVSNRTAAVSYGRELGLVE